MMCKEISWRGEIDAVGPKEMCKQISQKEEVVVVTEMFCLNSFYILRAASGKFTWYEYLNIHLI